MPGTVRRIGRVMAVRRLRQARTRRAVTLKIGQPRRTGDNWLVPVEIGGLGRRETRYIYGVDGVQALVLAVEFLRIRLGTVEPPLAWLDGPPGDLGLPRYLPWLGVSGLTARLGRLVDAEVERFARVLERTHRRRRRPTR